MSEGYDPERGDTHSLVIGYVLWIVGFFGIHRFYYGRPVSGTIWFFTFGLLLVGWLIDLLLIPGMERQADLKYEAGPLNYNLAWFLLAFLGPFGIHRTYMGKWITGAVFFAVAAGVIGFPPLAFLVLLGLLYDYWTLNDQLSLINEDWERA